MSKDYEKRNEDVESIQPSTAIPSSASSDLDDSYETYKQSAGLSIDETEAKAVLRKIDIRILPILFVTYLLQYLDKNGINYASVYGLQTGTKLKGQDFSWLGSIFYFGYLAGQFPAGYLMQRLPIAKFLGVVTLGAYPISIARNWATSCSIQLSR
jgi:sugar phosphate permease